MSQPRDTDELLKKLVEAPSMKLYSPEYTVSLFTEERLKHFEQLSKQNERLRVYDFVKFGLMVIRESQQERIYLTYGLLKLFEEVCRATNRDTISFLDLTSYVVEKLPKLTQQVRIQEKLLPFGLTLAESVKRSLLAPQVYGKKYNSLRRLEHDFACSDRYQHINRKIEKAFYSPSCRQFITLDNPSNRLEVFDDGCRHLRSVETELQLANRQAVIIDFGWSETQKRVGVILANYSSSFWSSTDEFRFELNVPLQRDYLKHPPIRIYYLECERKWLKFDSIPNIYSLSDNDFDICEQFHHSKLKCQKSDSLLVTEAAYHKLLVLGFDRTVLLICVERKEVVSELHDFRTNIYTLGFLQAYQVLLVGCFETYINLFELSQFCDLTEKGVLMGHQSHVTTAIAALQNSPIVLTVQDEGTMKLWDIRDLSCFQTLVAPSNILFRSVMQMDNGVALMGSKLFVFNYEQKKETHDKVSIVDLRIVNGKMMVVFNQAVSFFSMETGRVVRILKAIFQQEDIMACEYLSIQNLLLLVNPKGQLKAIDADNGGLAAEIQLPQGRPIRLRYEDHVKMMFYACDESISMFQYDHKRMTFELKRQIGHHDDSIRLADGSCMHDLVAFTYGGNVLYFYTHERMKPLGSMLASQTIVDFLFVTKHKLVGVLGETTLSVVSYEISYGNLATTTKYVLEKLWSSDIHSARIWQNNEEVFIASNSGHLIIVENKFKGEALGQELERNNYNPYRIGNESHKESFKRLRPSLSKRGREEYIDVGSQHHHHRHEIAGVVRYGSILLSVDVDASIRLVNSDGVLVGKVHLLNPLPQFWQSHNDKRSEMEEMQFVLELLQHLRLKNPKLAGNFAIDEMFRGMEQQAYLTQTITKLSRGSKRNPQEPQTIVAPTRRLSEKIVTSLREKKIQVEKQRDQRRNQDNYETLVRLNAKIQAVKNIGESQREKDIITFFDEAAVDAVKNKNIKQPPLPPEMKALEQRLNSLLKRSEERSYITEMLQKNRSSVTPVKVATETRSQVVVDPLMFYSTEMVRDRSKPRNAMDLVKSLKVSLLDSKFSRNSTSLPKLRSLSLRK